MRKVENQPLSGTRAERGCVRRVRDSPIVDTGLPANRARMVHNRSRFVSCERKLDSGVWHTRVQTRPKPGEVKDPTLNIMVALAMGELCTPLTAVGGAA